MKQQDIGEITIYQSHPILWLLAGIVHLIENSNKNKVCFEMKAASHIWLPEVLPPSPCKSTSLSSLVDAAPCFIKTSASQFY